MAKAITELRKARQEAISGLRLATDGKHAAEALEHAAELTRSLPGGDQEGDVIWAYAELLEAIAFAVRWQPAVRAAQPDSSRFQQAAVARAKAVLEADRYSPWPGGITAAAELLAAMKSAKDVAKAAGNLRATPLPVRISDVFVPRQFRWHPREEPAPLPPRCLVLLSIDGEPISSPALLHPRRTYKLGVRARLEQWPAEASVAVVDFMSVLQGVKLGRVELKNGVESGDTLLELETEISPKAAPVEIRTRGTLRMTDGSFLELPVIGHRRLLVATFDPDTSLPRNLPYVAKQLANMDAELRVKLPQLIERDHHDWFTLMESLVRYRNHVLSEGLLAGTGPVREKTFRADLARWLSADPSIGAALRKGGEAGRGILDLGLGAVPLELKVESKAAVSLATAHQYMGQPTQYASAGDCPVSVLCILDATPKEEPAGIHSEYIGWIYPKLHGLDDPRYPSMVAVVIVHTNFQTPSTFSKRSRRRPAPTSSANAARRRP